MRNAGSCELNLPQKEAGDVQKGMHVFLNGWPCVVRDIHISGTGKHGHTKARITGKCILTDKKYEIAVPGQTRLHVCPVQRADFQVLYIDDAKRSISILRGDDKEDALCFSVNDKLAHELVQAYKDADDSEADFVVTTITVPMPTDEDDTAHEERIVAWHQTGPAGAA